MEGKEPDHFSNPEYNSAPQPQPSPEDPHPSSISGSTVSIIQTTEDAKHRFAPATQGHFKILSIVQIILGLIAIICQTIVLIWATEIFSCMWHDFLFFFDLEPIPSEGAGLWCGVVFIFAGVIGLKACNNNDSSSQKAWITACMLINILCVLMVFALIGLAALNVTDVNGALCNRQNNLALAFDAFMILAGCVELVVCIWALLLSCDVRYSCFSHDREQSYNVMYNEDSRPSTPRAWSSEGRAPVPPTSTQAPVLVTPSHP